MNGVSGSDAQGRRATIVGTGLIGASIGSALRTFGWRVSAHDSVPGVVDRAIELGAVDAEGFDPASEIVFVATPVGTIVDQVSRALEACPTAVVTDVGGVKESIVAQVTDARFVGGHPMAGSERLGVEGADEGLFDGAAWALCPGPSTADSTYGSVREVVASLGAQVLTLSASDHDRLVAVVSHVPHLTAAALVRVADAHASDHAALLRLAAGGFRDMTRIAAGSPDIWPGVCAQNRDAILEVLDQLVDELATLRRVVAAGQGDELSALLGDAQQVRRNLPTRPSTDGPYSEVRVVIRNRPGAVAEVALHATELDVNLTAVATFDLDDSAVEGVAVLQVRAQDAERLRDGLIAAGYRASAHGGDET